MSYASYNAQSTSSSARGRGGRLSRPPKIEYVRPMQAPPVVAASQPTLAQNIRSAYAARQPLPPQRPPAAAFASSSTKQPLIAQETPTTSSAPNVSPLRESERRPLFRETSSPVRQDVAPSQPVYAKAPERPASEKMSALQMPVPAACFKNECDEDLRDWYALRARQAVELQPDERKIARPVHFSRKYDIWNSKDYTLTVFYMARKNVIKSLPLPKVCLAGQLGSQNPLEAMQILEEHTNALLNAIRAAIKRSDFEDISVTYVRPFLLCRNHVLCSDE